MPVRDGLSAARLVGHSSEIWDRAGAREAVTNSILIVPRTPFHDIIAVTSLTIMTMMQSRENDWRAAARGAGRCSQLCTLITRTALTCSPHYDISIIPHHALDFYFFPFLETLFV